MCVRVLENSKHVLFSMEKSKFSVECPYMEFTHIHFNIIRIKWLIFNVTISMQIPKEFRDWRTLAWVTTQLQQRRFTLALQSSLLPCERP